MERITLLEGVPFERELASLGLKYRTTKFEGLFRTSKINVYASFTQPPLQHQLQSIASYQSPYQSTPSYPTQQNGYPQPTSPPTYTLPVSRTPAPTNGSTTKMNPAAPTWASAAISGPAQVTTRKYSGVLYPSQYLTSDSLNSTANPTTRPARSSH